ncbi:MAG TPA: YbbC/YhhH family protein [Mucilaginibacter sp.]|jgi:hypothetical protein
MKYLLVCLILITLFSCKQHHTILGVEVAKKELRQALSEKSSEEQSPVKKIISNEKAAVAIAEPMLFKIYGKDDIISEKPYEIYLIDSYWVLSGTLPEGMYGGTFLIILSAKDGRVIKLTHGK